MSRRGLRWVLDAAIVASVLLALVLTLDPRLPQDETVVAADASSLSFGILPLAAHGLIFAGLGMVVALRLTLLPPEAQRRPTLIALTAIAVFAAADEQAQRLVDGHGPELVDWVADVTGASIGLATTRLTQWVRPSEA
jgi:hypothetical protein